MLLSSRRPGYHRRRRRWIVAITALLVIGWIAREPLLRRYARHRGAVAIERARDYAAKQDFDSAVLSLRIAAETGEFETERLRLTAEMLELHNDPRAESVREQVVRISNGALDDRLAYIRTAVRAGHFDAAERLFAQMAPAERQEPKALRALAALRLAQRRRPEAEETLAQLAAREPDDDAKIDLAMLRLQSSDANQREASRALLVRSVPSQPAGRAREILRELLRAAAAQNDIPAARDYARRLVELPAAPFDDYLRRANIERAWPGLSSRAVAAAIRSRAAQNAPDAAQFALWLTLTGQATEAVAWIEALPPSIRDAAPLRASLVAALAERRQWDTMAVELKHGAWGKIEPATIDQAMQAHRTHAAGKLDRALVEWKSAVTASSGRQDDLITLARLAALWRMDDAQSYALDILAQRFPDQTWALQQLAALAYEKRDTPRLLRTWQLWHRLHPEDGRVTCDWIMTSLLTNPQSNLVTEARRLYESAPDNRFFATAYAVALWRHGEIAPAVALMNRLPESERRQPARAPYYAAMLADSGQYAQAAEYLALADARRLLPEESAILKLATERIAQGRRPVADLAR